MKLYPYQATWTGLARIAAFTLFFLWWAGKCLPLAPDEIPHAATFEKTKVIPMMTNAADARYVTDIIPEKKGRTIAWITDSTGALFPADKPIPEAKISEVHPIALNISEKLQQNHQILLYLQTGMRAIGSQAAVAAAIRAKPDLIVLNVNPVWGFSLVEPQNRKNIYNTIPADWARNKTTLPWVLQLASPANILSSFVGAEFDVLRKAYAYRSGFDQKFLGKIPVPVDTRSLEQTASNSVFWGIIAEGEGYNPDFYLEDGKLKVRAWYRQLLKRSDTSGMGFSENAFAATLHEIEKSGIPAIIYLSPVSDMLAKKDPAVWKSLGDIRDYMEQAAERYKNNGIRIIPAIPSTVHKNLSFRLDDGAHLVVSAPLEDYLAGEIGAILSKKD